MHAQQLYEVQLLPKHEPMTGLVWERFHTGSFGAGMCEDWSQFGWLNPKGGLPFQCYLRGALTSTPRVVLVFGTL